MKKVFAVIAVVSSVLVGVEAKAANATATATVVTPISITKTADLQFGTFAKTGGSALVTIAANGFRDSSGVALLALTPTGAASFTVSGDATRTYAVTLPSTATLTHTNGTDTIGVDDFVSSSSRTIGADGTDTLNVGARISMPSTATLVGTYSGNFAVTVAYN